MNLVERAKAIVLDPRSVWPTIEREPGDTSYLFTNYVAIFALIPAVCGFLGNWLIAGRMGFFGGLFGAIIGYVLTFVVIYIVAMIVDLLAPTFNGQRNFQSALKLVVYSYTPAWLAGIFLLIPGLSFLSILGLYSIYVLWTGIPPMMKSPPERTLVYVLAIVACAIVLAIIIGFIQLVLFFGAGRP